METMRSFRKIRPFLRRMPVIAVVIPDFSAGLVGVEASDAAVAASAACLAFCVSGEAYYC